MFIWWRLTKIVPQSVSESDAVYFTEKWWQSHNANSFGSNKTPRKYIRQNSVYFEICRRPNHFNWIKFYLMKTENHNYAGVKGYIRVLTKQLKYLEWTERVNERRTELEKKSWVSIHLYLFIYLYYFLGNENEKAKSTWILFQFVISKATFKHEFKNCIRICFQFLFAIRKYCRHITRNPILVFDYFESFYWMIKLKLYVRTNKKGEN